MPAPVSRWRMLGLVWLAYICFGLTATTIAPLVGPILRDLDMSNSQMGLVLGVWQLMFIVTASPLGTLVDRMGERRAIAIGIVTVLASLVLRSLAIDFITLLFAVALFGVGGPIISIGAPKVVSLWFRGNQRGLAAGIYATGPVIGMSIALTTAASVVLPLTGSWRGVSVVYGGFVVLVLVLWLLFARNAPAEARSDGNGEQETERGFSALRALLRIGNVRIILILGMAAFMLNHGLQNWLPTLLEEKGLTLERAGMWVGIATALGVLGQLLVPVMARQGYRVFALAGMFTASALLT
ncbi:MAG: MFS transporter, partial [Dehalococcoidia bacterium]